LAQALLSDPEILILDEPTTGLDPLARKEIRDILAHLRDSGKTLMISSHELLEVEMISDRVSILYGGVLQACGKLDDLLTDRDTTIEAQGVPEGAIAKLRAANVAVEDKVGGRVRLRVPSDKSLYQVMDLCRQENVNVLSVQPKRETLEEFFVRVVGDARAREVAGVPLTAGPLDAT
jgi:ABC-2 type transport system ATP-binding protein